MTNYQRISYYSGTAGMIHVCILVFLTLMFGCIGVDFSINLTAQQNLQSGADSAALAAAAELFKNTSSSPIARQEAAIDSAVEYANSNISKNLTEIDASDVILGYIDPVSKKYDPSTFTTPSDDPSLAATGGYNAIRVKARASTDSGNGVPSVFGMLIGKEGMNISANAVAFMDTDISEISDNGGLRPIYGCVAQYNQTNSDGNPSNNTVRVYNDNFMVDGQVVSSGCPPQGAGNWGFADLRDAAPGAPGNSTLSDWWSDGFSGNPVTADSYYSTQPGNSISSNGVTSAIDDLIENKTVISIPLIDTDYTGSGSNTQVHVVAFTGMVITGYQSNGAAANRYIEGYFVNQLCRSNCHRGDGTAEPGGMAKLRLIH